MRKTDNELAGGWNCVRITSSGEEMLIATLNLLAMLTVTYLTRWLCWLVSQ